MDLGPSDGVSPPDRRQTAQPRRVMVEVWVEHPSGRYRITVLKSRPGHRWQIERDGEVVAQHDGSLPEGWPGEGFPGEVLDAVTKAAIQLSWS